MSKFKPMPCAVCGNPNDSNHDCNGWIPVGSHLPSMGQPVLTWGADECPLVCYRVASAHKQPYDWCTYEDQIWMVGITHWMPLPEPPTKVE